MATTAVPASLVGVSGWAARTTTIAVASKQPLGEYANDRELATACVVGTPGAFDALMHRYQRQVYHLCYRFVGNHEDASDLSQEVFVRAHRGLRRFKGGAALSTWLDRIGVNVCLSTFRCGVP